MAKRTIVVAIDESERSMHALRWALDTVIPPASPSACDDYRLILLHAKLPPTSTAAMGGSGYLLSAEVVVSLERAQERQIAELINRAQQICGEAQVKAETMIVNGDAREAICDTVEKLNACFLVVGSHGYGAIKRVVLGSVSDYCAHHARCPVVIVKKPHKKSHADDHQQEKSKETA